MHSSKSLPSTSAVSLSDVCAEVGRIVACSRKGENNSKLCMARAIHLGPKRALEPFVLIDERPAHAVCCRVEGTIRSQQPIFELNAIPKNIIGNRAENIPTRSFVGPLDVGPAIYIFFSLLAYDATFDHDPSGESDALDHCVTGRCGRTEYGRPIADAGSRRSSGKSHGQIGRPSDNSNISRRGIMSQVKRHVIVAAAIKWIWRCGD